ncbi:MAG: sel1 repeat family protein [Burkholderiaceae bacterium]|jgi:TPR repeat protein|nr:sel1 repeat family protein [Burkholderiaceae bacterium]
MTHTTTRSPFATLCGYGGGLLALLVPLCVAAEAGAPSALPVQPADTIGRANAGDPVAQYNLCQSYRKGDGVAQDSTLAFGWCSKSAQQAHAPAMYVLSDMTRKGEGGAQNESVSMEYLVKASKKQFPPAQYELGRLYEDGARGLKKDMYQARTLYMWASGQGYAPATYRIGTLYEYGKGVRPSMSAALRWYQKAAGMGDEEARARLLAYKQMLDEQAKPRAAAPPAQGAGTSVSPARDNRQGALPPP